jgi:hypothetical protein
MPKRTTASSSTVSFDQMCEAEKAQIEERRRQAIPKSKTHPNGYIGLAFSGGGIRSGTLNLGIIQGLAHFGALPYIDYLSTVSGGGYIGTWLHGVICRYGAGRPSQEVLDKLAPPDFAAPPSDAAGAIEDPVYFLRKYSSYLAPDVGLFSADFWTILVIWTRNTLLNQAILAPAMAIGALLLIGIGLLSQIPSSNETTGLKLLGCLIGLLVVIRGVSGGVDRVVTQEDCKDPEKQARNPFDQTRWAVIVSVAMLLFSAILASSAHSIINYQWPSSLATHAVTILLLSMGFVLFLLFWFLQFGSGFRKCCEARSSRLRCAVYLVLFPAIAAAATTGLLYGAMWWISSWTGSNADPWSTIAGGPAIIMLVWLFGTGLHIGLMGVDFPDFGREWLSRLGAFLFISLFAWAGLYALFIFGPWWMTRFVLHFGKIAAGALGTGWIATTAAGVLSGNSGRTSGSKEEPDKDQSTTLEWIAKIAPPIFMLGYLLLIGFAIHMGIRAMTGPYDTTPHSAAAPSNLTVQVGGVSPATTVQITYTNQPSPDWVETFRPVAERYWDVMVPAKSAISCLELLLACITVLLVMGLRININEFSLHHFYKNRLVRCYLGASRGRKRRGSRLTGFDPCDDMPLASLLAIPSPVASHKTPHKPYYGPFPIINTTLNLNRGSDLAKQERKGSSFVFTPLYSGYEPPPSQEDEEKKNDKSVADNGYRLTYGYSVPDGWSIGTCMAISGAAANPNWGYNTSAPVAFLLTIFDVRLGWWVGNTRLDRPSHQPGPKFALFPLLSELFAQTDSRSSFVNLSDGGHFENFGVYELVRRRVPYIIVGDGEQDGDYNFESLGGVIRKCRADFGVQIDIDPRRIRPKDGLSTTHCVVGKIHYPQDADHPNPWCGWILYLKSSLTGDEPEDIAQYKAAHSAFPHDPTPNQFFTESQFESYRRLGLHIIRSAFEDFGDRKFDPAQVEDTFERLYRKWHPPIVVGEGVVTRHAEKYSELMKRLCDDPDLAHLDHQILAGGTTQQVVANEQPMTRKEFFYCLELLQLMENVWGDLHFSEKSNRENPNHRGWMRLFEFWAQQRVFHATWKESRRTFNPLFQEFFDTMAGINIVREKEPCGDPAP